MENSNKIKRILVPVDFSPGAEKAFRYAMDIALKAKGTVILYHVYKPDTTDLKDTVQKRKQHTRQTEISLVKRMQRLKKKVRGARADVPVSTVLGRPPLIDNILAFAHDNRIDLIVMGTQGASGLKKTIIGSVAARIVEKTTIPVLLIPAKFNWMEPKRFVFAASYLKTDKKALSVVLALAKPYGAGVTIVHLLDVFANEEQEKTDFTTYKSSLQKEYNESTLEFKLMKTSSVAETMENLYKEISYDMLAMLRRKKTFMDRFIQKSFTKNMAYVTRHPLLVVPEKE